MPARSFARSDEPVVDKYLRAPARHDARAETSVLAHINRRRHAFDRPDCVPLYYGSVYVTGPGENRLHVLMRLVRGRSVADFVRLLAADVRASRTPLGRAARLCSAVVLGALRTLCDLATRANVVHNDFYGRRNVLVRRVVVGRLIADVVAIDFGVARIVPCARTYASSDAKPSRDGVIGPTRQADVAGVKTSHISPSRQADIADIKSSIAAPDRNELRHCTAYDLAPYTRDAIALLLELSVTMRCVMLERVRRALLDVVAFVLSDDVRSRPDDDCSVARDIFAAAQARFEALWREDDVTIF